MKSEVGSQKSEVKGTVPHSIKWGQSPKNRSTGNGFSLVEIMVAAVILSVSLLTIYSVYIKTFQASSRAEIKAIAVAIAQETVEGIVNRPYADIALWAGAGASPVPPSSYTFQNKGGGASVTETTVRTSSGTSTDYVAYQQTIIRRGISFTVTSIISWHDDGSDGSSPSDSDPNDYKRIYVSVSWPGGLKSVTLDRFVSLYFRPNASATAGSDAGEFRLSSITNYARLGSTNLEIYSGGNRTSDSEAKGFSTFTYNTGSNIAWVERFTDDDNGSSYPEQASLDETLGTFNNAPIFFKNGASNVARVQAGATLNIIGSSNWHQGELQSNDGWLGIPSAWPSPPSWSTVWKQPSSIAKSTLSNGFYWEHDPVQASIKLFETDESGAGSVMATTSDAADNKVASRSWADINGIKIAETGLDNGVPDSIVSIDSVEARVEASANGTSGGANTIRYWKITNLKVRGNNSITREYDSLTMASPDTGLSGITLPDPIESIVIGSSNNSTVQADGKSAQAQIVVLTITIRSGYTFTYNSQNIPVPASTITLGTAQASVSYNQ